jgi:hypothetical protein
MARFEKWFLISGSIFLSILALFIFGAISVQAAYNQENSNGIIQFENVNNTNYWQQSIVGGTPADFISQASHLFLRGDGTYIWTQMPLAIQGFASNELLTSEGYVMSSTAVTSQGVNCSGATTTNPIAVTLVSSSSGVFDYQFATTSFDLTGSRCILLSGTSGLAFGFPTSSFISAANSLNRGGSVFFWGTASTTITTHYPIFWKFSDTSNDIPSAVPIIGFTFPTNGTTTSYFEPWLLHASNLASADLYRTVVTWYATYPNGNKTVPLSNFNFSTGQQILNQGISIYRTQWNFDFAQNVQITATAQIFNTSDASGNSLAPQYQIASASTTIQFTLVNLGLASSTPPVIVSSTGNGTYSQATTTTFVVTNINPNPVSQSLCIAPSSSFDIGGQIGYGLCQAGSFLFVPSDDYKQNAQETISGFQSVFPFSVYFSVLGGVTNAINNNNVSTTQTLPLRILGFNGQYYTMATITSSTLHDTLVTASCDSDCVSHDINNLITPVKMGIWIVTAMKIIAMVASL